MYIYIYIYVYISIYFMCVYGYTYVRGYIHIYEPKRWLQSTVISLISVTKLRSCPA